VLQLIALSGGIENTLPPDEPNARCRSNRSFLAPLHRCCAHAARACRCATSTRSIPGFRRTRIDEAREITRYIYRQLLIFPLDFWATFPNGLATTVPAVVENRSAAFAPQEGERQHRYVSRGCNEPTGIAAWRQWVWPLGPPLLGCGVAGLWGCLNSLRPWTKPLFNQRIGRRLSSINPRWLFLGEERRVGAGCCGGRCWIIWRTNGTACAQLIGQSTESQTVLNREIGALRHHYGGAVCTGRPTDTAAEKSGPDSAKGPKNAWSPYSKGRATNERAMRKSGCRLGSIDVADAWRILEGNLCRAAGKTHGRNSQGIFRCWIKALSAPRGRTPPFAHA